jgi:hypothetical protein
MLLPVDLETCMPSDDCGGGGLLGGIGYAFETGHDGRQRDLFRNVWLLNGG